jgi:hypothetical protein
LLPWTHSLPSGATLLLGQIQCENNSIIRPVSKLNRTH